MERAAYGRRLKSQPRSGTAADRCYRNYSLGYAIKLTLRLVHIPKNCRRFCETLWQTTNPTASDTEAPYK